MSHGSNKSNLSCYFAPNFGTPVHQEDGFRIGNIRVFGTFQMHRKRCKSSDNAEIFRGIPIASFGRLQFRQHFRNEGTPRFVQRTTLMATTKNNGSLPPGHCVPATLRLPSVPKMGGFTTPKHRYVDHMYIGTFQIEYVLSNDDFKYGKAAFGTPQCVLWTTSVPNKGTRLAKRKESVKT